MEVDHSYGSNGGSDFDICNDHHIDEGDCDEEDEEELTGVARSCSATADFYQLQPSASSLIDDMNTMSMVATTAITATTTETTTTRTIPPKASVATITTSAIAGSVAASSASFSTINKQLVSNVGLHHPDGAASLRRDPGGFLLAPNSRRNDSTMKTKTTNSVSTLGIIETAHSIIDTEDNLSTERNCHHHQTAIASSNHVHESLTASKTLSKDAKDPPVSLAPRFSEPHNFNHHPQELFDWHRQYSFLSSRSASHDAIDGYHHHHGGGLSPTSTVNQVFLRRPNPCPSLPLEDDDHDEEEWGRIDRDTDDIDHQEDTVGTQLQCSSIIPPVPAGSGPNTTIPHAALSRHQSAPPSTVSASAMSSSRRSHGKPVLCRSLAWSQDSQDDLRLTKRARTTTSDKNSLLFLPPNCGDDGTVPSVSTTKPLVGTIGGDALDIANTASAFASGVSSTRMNTFDLDESWASNSSTSGFVWSAGLGDSRVRQAYGQTIFATSAATTMENNPVSVSLRARTCSTLSWPQSSHQQVYNQDGSKLSIFARAQQEDSSTVASTTKESREETSPTMVHWCQKLNDGQDLITQVHLMHHSRSAENDVSPASILTDAHSATPNGLWLSALQQPKLNHSAESQLSSSHSSDCTNQFHFPKNGYHSYDQFQSSSSPAVMAAASPSHYSFEST